MIQMKTSDVSVLAVPDFLTLASKRGAGRSKKNGRSMNQAEAIKRRGEWNVSLIGLAPRTCSEAFAAIKRPTTTSGRRGSAPLRTATWRRRKRLK